MAVPGTGGVMVGGSVALYSAGGVMYGKAQPARKISKTQKTKIVEIRFPDIFILSYSGS